MLADWWVLLKESANGNSCPGLDAQKDAMKNLPSPYSADAPAPSGQGPSGREQSPPIGPVLRRARKHCQLSLREVERRIGRSNAYLSQIERGLIRQPDPVVLLELAELYRLNFMMLATWAGWAPTPEQSRDNQRRGGSTTALMHRVLELDDSQRTQVLEYIERLLRERRT